ncbi:MAG: hypothetical protein NVSMB49_23760 [Ktedonobacteraceae bacterium]
MQIWNATTGETLLTFRGHTDGVLAVSWSPDSTRIASIGLDGTVRVWDATTGAQQFINAKHRTNYCMVT